MSQLFVRLLGAAHMTEAGLDLPVQWLAQDDAGPVLAEGTVNLADVAADTPPWPADPRNVIVLAPVEQTLWLSASVPGRSTSQIARALPFAVEEFLTQDVETMHLAHGPILRGTPVPCILLDRQLLADWLAALAGAGLAPDCMVPDASLLPEDSGVTVLFDGGDVLLRTPEHMTRMDPVLLHDALAAPEPTSRETDAQPEPAWTLEVIGGTTEDIDALGAVFPGEVVGRALSGSVLRYLASRFVAPPAIDMLQGRFAPSKRSTRSERRWRGVAALAAVWGLVFVGVQLGEGLWAEHRADALRVESVALFRELFPGERPARNVYAEMRRRIGTVERPTADFRTLIGQLALGMERTLEGAELQSLSFSESRGELSTELSLREYSDLDRLKAQLEGQGLAVQIGSAEEQDGIVRARLRLGPT